MSKKILLFIIIPFLLLFIIGIIIYIVKHNSHYPSNSKQKKVMFGLALQSNTTGDLIIDLTKLKGKISCFWNWASSVSVEDLKNQYKWNQDLNIEFLPMLWGSTTQLSLPSSYNYVMLSNEPDMIGGCVDPKVNPCSDGNTDKSSPATSSRTAGRSDDRCSRKRCGSPPAHRRPPTHTRGACSVTEPGIQG